MTAANMVRALEAQGYDQEMARLALDVSAYAGIDEAVALLNEWGVEQAPGGEDRSVQVSCAGHSVRAGGRVCVRALPE